MLYWAFNKRIFLLVMYMSANSWIELCLNLKALACFECWYSLMLKINRLHLFIYVSYLCGFDKVKQNRS